MMKRFVPGLIMLLGITSTAMAGKPAPPASTNIPASVTFRCPGLECGADRIAGDVYGDYANDVTRYYFNTDGGHGALWMRVGSPRYYALDFTSVDGVAPCTISRSGCRRNFSIIQVPNSSNATAINPTDAYDVELPSGFESIPVGGSAWARVKINFPDPAGRAYEWTIRFNAGMYPGSTNVAVRRLSESTWEVEATENDRARLVCRPTGGGKQVTSDEGLFIMPFKLTVTK